MSNYCKKEYFLAPEWIQCTLTGLHMRGSEIMAAAIYANAHTHRWMCASREFTKEQRYPFGRRNEIQKYSVSLQIRLTKSAKNNATTPYKLYHMTGIEGGEAGGGRDERCFATLTCYISQWSFQRPLVAEDTKTGGCMKMMMDVTGKRERRRRYGGGVVRRSIERRPWVCRKLLAQPKWNFHESLKSLVRVNKVRSFYVLWPVGDREEITWSTLFSKLSVYVYLRSFPVELVPQLTTFYTLWPAESRITSVLLSTSDTTISSSTKHFAA